VGGDRLEVVVSDPAQVQAAAQALHPVSTGDITIDAEDSRVVAPVVGGSLTLVEAVRALDAAHVAIADVALRRPTLDDVFLTLTGHAAEEEQA
jgi:ABC-2 type transport system ATP-binding protein